MGSVVRGRGGGGGGGEVVGEGRGKCEEVSAEIEFSAWHNGDRGGGGHVKSIEIYIECVYRIESEY